jgi:hypothetical protein
MKLNYDSTEASPRSNRVPLALQAIFLQSNQGREVHIPPSNNLANRVFVAVTRRDKNRNKWDGKIISKKFREIALRDSLLLPKYVKLFERDSSEFCLSQGKINTSPRNSKHSHVHNQRPIGKRRKKSKVSNWKDVTKTNSSGHQTYIIQTLLELIEISDWMNLRCHYQLCPLKIT